MAPESTPQPHFRFTDQLPVTRRALEFARSRHGRQRRDADGARFLVHPAEVASLLARLGYDDQVVAAAVLHDVLEKTATRPSDLATRFGRRVADLVKLVSDDPEISDEAARKADTRGRVRAASGDALAVYAADKVSKVRELRLLIVAGLPSSAVEVKLDRYQAALIMLEDAPADQHLVALLRFEIEALQQLPPASPAAQALESAPGMTDPAASLAAARRAALMIANQSRRDRARLKRALADGVTKVSEVITDPPVPALGWPVGEVLRSQSGWGPRRTSRFLAPFNINERKPVGELTARQRAAITDGLQQRRAVSRAR